MNKTDNRIARRFKSLANEGRKAFIPYITAGDPDLRVTAELVLSLDASGADIIELGVPFSDPLADGPTIQKAMQRALEGGTTPAKILDMVRSLRKRTDVPLVLMTYYNIVHKYGLERFARDAARCGVDGVIVPDLPLEESGPFSAVCAGAGVAFILLAAPTTPLERFRSIAKSSKGFIYYVSLTGVTGGRGSLARELGTRVKEMKSVTSKPVCVGFGISNAEQARTAAVYADGVIVGSAIIRIIEEHAKDPKLIARVERFARDLARAVHGAGGA